MEVVIASYLRLGSRLASGEPPPDRGDEPLYGSGLRLDRMPKMFSVNKGSPAFRKLLLADAINTCSDSIQATPGCRHSAFRASLFHLCTLRALRATSPLSCPPFPAPQLPLLPVRIPVFRFHVSSFVFLLAFCRTPISTLLLGSPFPAALCPLPLPLLGWSCAGGAGFQRLFSWPRIGQLTRILDTTASTSLAEIYQDIMGIQRTG
jgi:hypothetical protein